jgi:hypothetical protein
MYWRIGRLILIRQENEPCGSGVIKRLAGDLRREFPDMKGLSPTNLQYMRAFAAAWPGTDPISQRVVLGTTEAPTVTVTATDLATRVGCSRNC